VVTKWLTKWLWVAGVAVTLALAVALALAALEVAYWRMRATRSPCFLTRVEALHISYGLWWQRQWCWRVGA